MSCKNIMKFKFRQLFSNKWLTFLTVFIVFFMNYCAVVNSGVLFSGGGGYNETEKYTLLINNYSSVSSLYGLLLAVCLGAGTIGPDLLSGNIYVILSAYSSRYRYFAVTAFSAWIYYFMVQILLTMNFCALLLIFDVTVIWPELVSLVLGTLLNATVVFVITSVCSIYLKGYQAVVAGLGAYAYYYICTFNTIPFVDEYLVINIVKYKNILCNFVPMKYLLIPSITDSEVLQIYETVPLGGNMYLYQFVYIIAVLILGCILIEKKDI